MVHSDLWIYNCPTRETILQILYYKPSLIILGDSILSIHGLILRWKFCTFVISLCPHQIECYILSNVLSANSLVQGNSQDHSRAISCSYFFHGVSCFIVVFFACPKRCALYGVPCAADVCLFLMLYERMHLQRNL